jgi:hypothetical protein
MPQPVSAPTTPPWNLNDSFNWLHRLSWLVTALLLLQLLVQSVRLQRWAWSLRGLSAEETALLRDSVLECAGPPALSNVSRPAKSSRGLEHSKTLPRMQVSNEICIPCVAGWFFPVIAVPAPAFQELTPPQWRWLIRHESEHLRMHDTVAVLLQNIALAFLWWNPFAHALIEEFSRAREEACDAAAVEEEPDQSFYIDFLLSWAAKPSPSRFAMSIARSRPARRLQDRLVALMEARGVRKKLGALFVLGCLAFAVLAPFSRRSSRPLSALLPWLRKRQQKRIPRTRRCSRGSTVWLLIFWHQVTPPDPSWRSKTSPSQKVPTPCFKLPPLSSL